MTTEELSAIVDGLNINDRDCFLILANGPQSLPRLRRGAFADALARLSTGPLVSADLSDPDTTTYSLTADGAVIATIVTTH